MAGTGAGSRRPAAIAWFERLYLLSLLASAWGVIAFLSVLVGLPGHERAGAGIVAAVTLGLFVGLVLLVSRRRSRAAMWAVAALTGLTAAFWLLSAIRTPGITPFDAPGLVQHLLQIAAVALLFTAPARAWLEKTTDAA